MDFTDPRSVQIQIEPDGEGRVIMTMPDDFDGGAFGMLPDGAKDLAKALLFTASHIERTQAGAAAISDSTFPNPGDFQTMMVNRSEKHVVLDIPPEMTGTMGIVPDTARSIGVALLTQAFLVDGVFPAAALTKLLLAARGKGN